MWRHHWSRGMKGRSCDKAIFWWNLDEIQYFVNLRYSTELTKCIMPLPTGMEKETRSRYSCTNRRIFGTHFEMLCFSETRAESPGKVSIFVWTPVRGWISQRWTEPTEIRLGDWTPSEGRGVRNPLNPARLGCAEPVRNPARFKGVRNPFNPARFLGVRNPLKSSNEGFDPG